MSASSGISASEGLKTAWSSVVNDQGVRIVKVQIVNNEMVETARIARTSSLSTDWGHIAAKLDGNPCYLLIRLDQTTSTGDCFLMALYVPEATAQVRDKMLYASSRDTLKKDLGRSYFVEDYFASDLNDMSYTSYSASHASDSATTDSLLTAAERAKKEEARMEKDVAGSKDSVHGVSFALTDAARGVLQSYVSGKCNWASVTIDIKNEKVEAGESKNVATESINDHISNTQAFYYFYRYDHKNNKDENVTVHLFIYCCPEDVPIKQKMLS